jgi:hypothetical protein
MENILLGRKEYKLKYNLAATNFDKSLYLGQMTNNGQQGK